MTRRGHARLWRMPDYIALVESKCAALGCDGCTGVPDFFLMGCLEHDIAYRTGRDPFGKPITKREADERLKWYIQNHSVFGRLSPLAMWRWWFVRTFVSKAWRGNK